LVHHPISGGRLWLPGNKLAVDLGTAAGKQLAHFRRKKSFVLAGIDVEKNLAAWFELSLE